MAGALLGAEGLVSQGPLAVCLWAGYSLSLSQKCSEGQVRVTGDLITAGDSWGAEQMCLGVFGVQWEAETKCFDPYVRYPGEGW